MVGWREVHSVLLHSVLAQQVEDGRLFVAREGRDYHFELFGAFFDEDQKRAFLVRGMRA